MIIEVGHTYLTRSGHKVHVHEIRLHDKEGKRTYTFPVKGTLMRPTKSGRVFREFNIWKIDGRFGVFGNGHHLDLVEDITEV